MGLLLNVTYSKNHLKSSEHVRVGVGHSDLMSIPYNEEHINKLVFPQIFHNVLDVFSVSSLRVVEALKRKV